MNHRSLALVFASTVTALATGARADFGTMYGDHYLFPGQRLQSSCQTHLSFETGGLYIMDWALDKPWEVDMPNGDGFVAMQGDGNLVIYDWNYNPVWSTGTYNYPGAYAVMQSDGNFVVRDSSGHARWASHTAGFYSPTPIPPPPITETPPCGARSEQMSIYHGWDLPGNDYTHFVMTSRATPEGCAAACAADTANCAAFTYVPAGVQNSRPVCWLKSHFAGNWHATGGMASGSREVIDVRDVNGG